MSFSQELPFVIQSLICNLTVLLACFGLLIMALVRRQEAPVAAKYVIAGVVLITMVQFLRAAVMPNLPRLIGTLFPGRMTMVLVTAINIGFSILFALGLLSLGAAVFMDRRK